MSRWGADATNQLHVRFKSCALGKYWKVKKKLLIDHGAWKDTSILGSSPHTGFQHLACASEEEIDDLVRLSMGSDCGGGKDAFTIMVFECAKKFQVPEATLNSLTEHIQSFFAKASS
ncbi:unnamed protein product [Prorocentrum cordatum]|uniref:Uncharacterized protein n=1 Tax=Prorocentrum cordatum TaxID=2364126 RepID=A0ABN9V5Z1_9DINO|nr:unnamed protein product [Polarella glacialis]